MKKVYGLMFVLAVSFVCNIYSVYQYEHVNSRFNLCLDTLEMFASSLKKCQRERNMCHDKTEQELSSKRYEGLKADY